MANDTKSGLNPLEEVIHGHIKNVAKPAADIVGYVPGIGKPVAAAMGAGAAALDAQLTAKAEGRAAVEGLREGATAAVKAAVDAIPGMGVARAAGISGGDDVTVASSGLPSKSDGKGNQKG